MSEEQTTRLLYYNDYLEKFGTCSGQRTVRDEDESVVIGYAEVKKGYPFESRDTEEEFVSYMETHPAVKYVTWFEDRRPVNP